MVNHWTKTNAIVAEIPGELSIKSESRGPGGLIKGRKVPGMMALSEHEIATLMGHMLINHHFFGGDPMNQIFEHLRV
jgi:hypothetical protein